MKYIPLLGMLVAGATNAAPCLDYHEVEVAGVLLSETFPGPPNNESVAVGDKAETYFFVNLDKPACVSKGSSAIEPEAQGIQKIQLVFDFKTARESYEQLRPSLASHVSCTGVLFGRHTGHHHSEVLLTVSRCRAI